MTHESLQGLHSSLKSMPPEDADTFVEPKRLKVPLMSHQRRAVTWGLWRETQNPPGGILGTKLITDIKVEFLN